MFVCVCAQVSSQSEKVEALQSFLSFFTHKVQLPTGVQLFFFKLMKGTWWPLPSPHRPPSPPHLKKKQPHKWLPTVAVIAVYIWNVCSLCKKSWTSASVKLWDAVTVCIHERPLSRYLSTSRLLFGFWMTESKGRIYFGISVFFFFQYISLQKFQFCIFC